MKTIGINSSPRKNGNTQTLVEAALAGAAEKGSETSIVHLRDLEINGCLGCEGCKRRPGKCVQEDDLTPLMQQMAASDAIVLGTPVYWFHVSAQCKALIDRFYSFISETQDPQTGETSFSTAFPPGRNMLFLISRGDPEPPSLLPQFYDYLNQWLNIVPVALGIGKFELIQQFGAQTDRKAAQNDGGLIDKVMSAGAGLV